MKKKKKVVLYLSISIVLALIIGLVIGGVAIGNKDKMRVEWDFQTKVINAESCNKELPFVLVDAESTTKVSNSNLVISVFNNLREDADCILDNKNRCSCLI